MKETVIGPKMKQRKKRFLKKIYWLFMLTISGAPKNLGVAPNT